MSQFADNPAASADSAVLMDEMASPDCHGLRQGLVMRRWSSQLFITLYLTALSVGLLSHAMKFLTTSHPAMYFIVWDMYCGWSAYEGRIHMIGEGESGRFYEIAPTPWGEFRPYQSCNRIDYDAEGRFSHRLAQNTLAHTAHEPILRTYLIEEFWSKKYNLPDSLWSTRFAETKDRHSYFHVRSTTNSRGEVVQSDHSWLNTQYQMAVLDNPRLRREAMNGQTFFAASPDSPPPSRVQPASFETSAD